MEQVIGMIIILGAIVGIPFLFYNKKIVFELDDRYYNLNDLRNAAVKYLKKEGKNCEIVDNDILLVDKQKYYLTERTVNFKAPVQQVVLKKVK